MRAPIALVAALALAAAAAGCTEVIDRGGGACEPGALSCLGDDVAVCSEDGTRRELFKLCPEESPCGGSPPDCPGVAFACVLDADCAGRLGDLGACRVARCEEGQCRGAPAPSLAPCDDGNACTEGDACKSGVCVGTAVDCDDGNACTADRCDPAAGCASEADDLAACDDGDLCTLTDRCDEGACVGAPRDCDDDNPCTLDTCDPETGSCVSAPLAGPCDDGDACTEGDACVDGQCTPAAFTCPCVADGDCPAAVSDDPCQGRYACSEGFCKVDPASVLQCSDDGLGPCVVATCVSADGVPACVLAARPLGFPCNDADPCTTQDQCVAGLCQGQPNPAKAGCGVFELRAWSFSSSTFEATSPDGLRLRGTLGAPRIVGEATDGTWTVRALGAGLAESQP